MARRADPPDLARLTVELAVPSSTSRPQSDPLSPGSPSVLNALRHGRQVGATGALDHRAVRSRSDEPRLDGRRRRTHLGRKLLPHGNRLARPIAVLLIALGIWVAIAPKAVPGLTQPDSPAARMMQMNGSNPLDERERDEQRPERLNDTRSPEHAPADKRWLDEPLYGRDRSLPSTDQPRSLGRRVICQERRLPTLPRTRARLRTGHGRSV